MFAYTTKNQARSVAMAPLLKLLSLFALLSLSHSESKGGPRDSVCKSNNKGFIPFGQHGDTGMDVQKKGYKVFITLIREVDNQTVTCVEGNTKYIGTFAVNYLFAYCFINAVFGAPVVRINATHRFNGFIITSTKPGVGYPANFVGVFEERVEKYSDENLALACENTISHS